MNTLLDSNNHLFTLARSGKRLPHIILAVILTFIFIFIATNSGGTVAVVLNLALSIASGDLTPEALLTALENNDLSVILPDTALEQVIFLVLGFAPIFLILWGWVALFEKRPFWTMGFERSGAIYKYFRGLGVGLLMFAAAVAISALMGYVSFEEVSNQPHGLTALGGVLFVFLGWTVQGPAEEAITRGWLMPVLGARYNAVVGVLVSSLVFAILHSLNFFGLALAPHLILLSLFNLFLFGLFAALYALYEESLWGVCSIHAIWNWAQGNFFGFAVSGGNAPGGTLLDLMETGPDFITGGRFGPEGGLAVTLVLVISCVWLWRLGLRKSA